MSSLLYVQTTFLLSVSISGLHNEIENMDVKCVGDTKLGGIITIFKDSIRFQGDLNELERSFMLFRKKQRFSVVRMLIVISHEDKNICN